MILLGAGLSCPLLGQISVHLNKRKPLIHASCLSTALLLILVLYLPIQSKLLMGFLMFSMGLTCGAYMLAYSISNELAPLNSYPLVPASPTPWQCSLLLYFNHWLDFF